MSSASLSPIDLHLSKLGPEPQESPHSKTFDASRKQSLYRGIKRADLQQPDSQKPVHATDRERSSSQRRNKGKRQTFADILAYITPHRSSSIQRLPTPRLSPGPLSSDAVKISVSREVAASSPKAEQPFTPKRGSPPRVNLEGLQDLLTSLPSILSTSSAGHPSRHSTPLPAVKPQRLPTVLEGCSCCVFIVMLCVFFFYGISKPQPLCSSDACLSYAKLLWDMLNLSANPCDDFYGYVCSKWDATHAYAFKEGIYFKMMRRVADRNLHTAVPTHGQSAAQKAAQFYQSCLQIHMAGGEQEQRWGKQLLDKFGVSWPRLSNASNLLRTCFAFSNILGWAPIISFDIRRPGRVLVTPASFYYTVLATRRAMLSTGSGDREYKTYFKLMLNAFGQANESAALSYGDLLTLESEVVPELRQSYNLASGGVVENATLDDVLKMVGQAISRSRWQDAVLATFKSADLDDTAEISFTIDNVHFFKAFFELCRKVGEARMVYYVGWAAVQAWSLLTKPYMIRFYYQSPDDDGHMLLCAVLTQGYMGLAFYANYIREELSAEDIRDVNAVARNVYTSFRNGFPASVVWKAFIASSLLSLDQNTSSPSGSSAPLSFVSDAQEKHLNALFDYFPDMTPKLLRNAHGATAAMRKTPAETRMANFRWNSTVRFYYLTRGGRFELLPVALEPPFYSSRAPPAVKYGTLGAEISDATAAVVFQKAREAASYTRAAVGSEALCVQNAENPVTKALPVSPNWSNISRWQLAERAMSLDAVLRAFLSATEGGEQSRLDGFESLTGKQILFIFWCMAKCGVDDGKHKCNDPLKLFRFFARTFECKAGSSMSTVTECI